MKSMLGREVATKRKGIRLVEIYDMYTYSAASDLELGAGGALLDLHGGGIGSETQLITKEKKLETKKKNDATQM